MTKELLDKARINFKSGVPELLFKKTNAKCSVPRCKNPTTGPYKEIEDVAANMGVACHIYSAAEGGPRGRGGRSPEFIKSEENGIWCCQYHASLIDKKNGIDYTAPTLLAWKKLAEARTRKLMNDEPSPLGWIESIEFKNFRPVKNLKVHLSRYTLITGKNGSGKTAILEAAATICNSKYFHRLASSYSETNGIKKGVRIDATVTYTTVDVYSKELHIVADNFIIRRFDGTSPCLLPPGDIEVIFCSEDDSMKSNEEDDFNFFMRALNVDASALIALVDIGPSKLLDGSIRFRDEMIEDDDGKSYPRLDDYGNQCRELVLKRTRYGKTFEVCYDGLATSEKNRLLIALSITKAREVAKQKLTLLLIENLASNFDEGNFENLLRVLQNEDFQVVVTMPYVCEDSISDKEDGVRKLRNYDYLANWKLRTI